MQNQTSPLILTFGATDPSGATGIQADLASFAAMGCHGLSAVTSILIADSARVEDMQVLDADWVSDQARAVLEDMPVGVIKVGVLGSIENVAVIAEIVSDYPDLPLILDPFVSALPERDDSEEVLAAMRELLLPQTALLLASAVELRRLAETWREAVDEDMLAADAMHIVDNGCEYVLVTGTGGDAQEITNMLFDGTGLLREDTWPRLPGPFSGAGSTLSAAIAAMLAKGMEMPEAVFEAQEFVHAALTGAQRLGMGKLTPDRYFWARESDQQSD